MYNAVQPDPRTSLRHESANGERLRLKCYAYSSDSQVAGSLSWAANQVRRGWWPEDGKFEVSQVSLWFAKLDLW